METRTRILETALRLFLVQGYENTSMRQVAESLGISKPAIYHYFKGKEDLALQVVGLFEERTRKWVTDKSCDVRDFGSFMRFKFEAIPVFSHVEVVVLGEDAHDDSYRHGFNDLISSLAGINPDVRKRVAAIFEHARGNIQRQALSALEAGHIRDDVDTEALAFMVHAIIEGMGVLGHFDPGIDEADISRRMFQMFMKMINYKGPSASREE
ncbi:MAG: TetR/AcrR family transcriptional regulator [Candidatus Cloacimonetes bacterium]|nr:TetR/AcrR family transcriptional regulator [Candidatus Cloacimonadota bacterium]